MKGRGKGKGSAGLRARGPLLGLGALLVILAHCTGNTGTNAAPFHPVLPDDSLYAQGRYVYQRHCAVCHGERGDGRGEMARGMFPRPRPFTVGVFKYRSTPPGFLPTDADLVRIIRQGISGTSMPAFTQLSARELRVAAEYIKFFSDRWTAPDRYAPPVRLPALPDWWQDLPARAGHVARGQQRFNAACAPCHGLNGDGRGPSAETLLDEWDQPCRPPSLRQPTLRSGPGALDLHRTLVTGIGGTPMPSYAETFTDEERWELVALIEAWRVPPARLP